MPIDPVPPEFTQASLKSLKLRAGMFLQTRRAEKNSPNYEAQFLGVIEDKCLMVVPVGTFSIKTGMKAGETFIIRGFTGQFDFNFTSTVIQAFDFTFREPAYAYAVLSFPQQVNARKVRNSLRIKTSLPAMASAPGQDTQLPVQIVDLSVDGALVHAPASLGATGDLVSLAFSLGEDTEPVYIVGLARICHAGKAQIDDGTMVGMLFENLVQADRLMIKEFVLAHID